MVPCTPVPMTLVPSPMTKPKPPIRRPLSVTGRARNPFEVQKPGVVGSGDLRPWGAPTVAHNLDDGDAAWIALVSPAIAEPLAAWLESWDGIPFNEHGPMADDLQHALNVARTILGEPS